MQRFETKFDLLQEAYKDTGLKKGTIALLQYLVYKSNREECFVSVGTIAAALNVCVRTVQNNMRKLEKAGYVIRKDRWYDHQQLSNRYLFNLGITEETEGGRMPADKAQAPGEGISEDNVQTPRKAEYTNEEKERIHLSLDTWKCLEGGGCRNAKDAEPISKTVELKKIYSMPLKGREKELLVYLIHKADEQGMAYGESEVFMEAVGVGSTTLKKWLKKLQSKSLIKVKGVEIYGKIFILVQLTGNIWRKEGEKENQKGHVIQQFSQKVSAAPHQKSENSMQISRQKGGIYIIHMAKNQICKMKGKLKEFWQLLPFRLKKVRKILLL